MPTKNGGYDDILACFETTFIYSVIKSMLLCQLKNAS